MTLILLAIVSGTIGYFMGSAHQMLTNEKENEIFLYEEALRIFFKWKKEIGGVALKGVGQHYEKWIHENLRKARENAGYKTEK